MWCLRYFIHPLPIHAMVAAAEESDVALNATVQCWSKSDGEWNETHKVKAELPHVFLKHNNEKQCMKKKQPERRGKRGRQLHGKGEREGRNGASGVQGGLQAEQHVNAERQALLTRSLTRHFLLTECPVQLLLCVSLPLNPLYALSFVVGRFGLSSLFYLKGFRISEEASSCPAWQNSQFYQVIVSSKLKRRKNYFQPVL